MGNPPPPPADRRIYPQTHTSRRLQGWFRGQRDASNTPTFTSISFFIHYATLSINNRTTPSILLLYEPSQLIPFAHNRDTFSPNQFYVRNEIPKDVHVHATEFQSVCLCCNFYIIQMIMYCIRCKELRFHGF